MRDVAGHNTVRGGKEDTTFTEKISYGSLLNINQANVRAKFPPDFTHAYNSLRKEKWKLSELLDPVPRILINFIYLGIVVSIC